MRGLRRRGPRPRPRRRRRRAAPGRTGRTGAERPTGRRSSAATSSPPSPPGRERCPPTRTARCASCRRTRGSGSDTCSSARTTSRRRRRCSGPSWSVTPGPSFFLYSKVIARLQSCDFPMADSNRGREVEARSGGKICTVLTWMLPREENTNPKITLFMYFFMHSEEIKKRPK